MTDPGFSGKRIDHAADAAITTHNDESEGQSSPSAHTELAEGKDSGGSEPSTPGPDQGTTEEDGDVPATEGNRQLVETLRSIERLEESN